MIHVEGMNAGGHNGTDGGYFYHTVKDIDVGKPDFKLLIIQEMHDAESGEIVRQSIGLGMTCYLQYTTYQNRHYRTGKFQKKIEFFGTGLWESEMRRYAERQFYNELEELQDDTDLTFGGMLSNLFG